MGLANAGGRVIALISFISLLVLLFPNPFCPTPTPVPIYPNVCTLKSYGIKNGSLWSGASGKGAFMTQALTLKSHNRGRSWTIGDAENKVTYSGSFKYDQGKCTASGKINGEDNLYKITFSGHPAKTMIYSYPSIEGGTVTLNLVPQN